MEAVIFLMAGIIVGSIVTWSLISNRKPSGTFTINLADPMDETLRLDIRDDLNYISTKKRIIFSVKVIR